MVTILFLAANPVDTISLRLDEELRAIDRKLRQSEFRDIFELEQQWAVRVSDLQEFLLRHKPHIVHFSGHGSQSSEIVFQDDSGYGRPVSVRALSSLFSTLKDNIRCVVLNACYSENQAQVIAQHIECVVGMSRAITDPAAISFASSFYQALGFGRSIKTAFELGCGQIDIEGLSEQDTPKLLTLRSDPRNISFQSPSDRALQPESGMQTKSCIRIRQVETDGEASLVESQARFITIGRAPKSTMKISDPQVSWEHGQIILMHGTYYYHHISNTSPTTVQRKGESYLLRPGKHEDFPLRNQDRLIIGNIKLVIEFDLIAEDKGYTTTSKKPENT
ncbi:MAG: hypothetical protein DRJ03_19460 [Chloroflexi bacterium]|nr:MAG: hypothetical protein DRJ03_19460 [Chloroflexota bacterium]RLI53726.1 MAG: hypothetical protein DRP09_14980 [Candidatus Thorarchaeota archaeon]